jgi:hypothetical protein
MTLLRGCGYDATVINIGAGLGISAFYDNFDKNRVFSDFSVIGDDTAGQAFYEAGAAVMSSDEGQIFDRINAYHVEKCFLNDPAGFLALVCTNFGWLGSSVANPNSLTCDGQGILTTTDSFFTDGNFGGLVGGFGKNGGSTGWGIRATNCYIMAVGNGAYCPDPLGGIQATNTAFVGNGDAASVIRLSSTNCDRISACQFNSCYVEVNFISQFAGCMFLGPVPARQIDILSAGTVVVSGCLFTGFVTEAIRNAGTTKSVITGNYNCPVTETSTSCQSLYSNNSFFSGSTIIGSSSVVDGATKADAAANSTNALVTIVSVSNPKGVLGIGTVKNTGGVNLIDVKESFTDAFGTTSSITTTVTPGNSYMLDPQTNMGTGFPPYVSYQVQVIDTVPASHSSYVSHFTSQGAI